jgi:hypothetical protein
MTKAQRIADWLIELNNDGYDWNAKTIAAKLESEYGPVEQAVHVYCDDMRAGYGPDKRWTDRRILLFKSVGRFDETTGTIKERT